MPATLITRTRPRNEDFIKCLTCNVRKTHTVHWEGNKKFYQCENCGFTFWIYIEPVGPNAKRDTDEE